MDPIEIIVTSVDSLSSSPSATSYQSSPNGQSSQYVDRTRAANAPNDIVTKAPLSTVTIQRTSSDRWNSTRLGANDNNKSDHKNDDNNKRPLLSISIPNSQSSNSLHTPKTTKQTSTQHLSNPTGMPCHDLATLYKKIVGTKMYFGLVLSAVTSKGWLYP